ncbi:MAG: HAD-IIIA family hydrolase [Burkholderiales bacterium]|nr:HAD-IIIA family hydrolase [Burkholderiales bacterium]
MRVPAQRRFRLLVFDWDGTLSDSTAIIADAIRSACRDLGEPVPDEATARYVIGLGLTDALRLVAPGLPLSRHSELTVLYRRHYLAREDDIPLFAGASGLLAELEAAGYLLAVATGKSRLGLARVLARSGLAQRFHATRCADEGFPKPHPDMLLHLMDHLAVVPDETLMIGDTTHDLELARNAGASALAVAYGAHDVAGLARLAPLATVHSIAEMREWLARNG